MTTYSAKKYILCTSYAQKERRYLPVSTSLPE